MKEKVKRGRMKKETPVTCLAHAAVRVTNVAKNSGSVTTLKSKL